MKTLTRQTDAKARLSLPRTFANATVIIEHVSETELRLRKARIVPEDEARFDEESTRPLTDRDRDIFLRALSKPPRANRALRKAAARYNKHHG